MVHAFIRLIFGQESLVAISRMADHLVDLLDIVAGGVLSGQREPLISEAVLENWLTIHENDQRRNPLQLIKEMKRLLGSVPEAGRQDTEEGLESLIILESELLMPSPRKAVIRGMLANLQAYPVLAGDLAALQRLITPYMPKICGAQ
ncbi:hypothetical protein D3C73_1276360 [compost metagenome]